MGRRDFLSKRFFADEVSTAKWLELIPDWHHGYPQPEQDFGFPKTTYDLANWCADCRSPARRTERCSIDFSTRGP